MNELGVWRAKVKETVALVRESLGSAERIAFQWDPGGPTNPPEEAQVRWFIRTAFAQTEMLLEMLGLTETLKRVQKIEEEAKKNYAEYGYFEDLFLKWAEELRTFLDVIEAQPQVSIIGISEIAQVLKSVPSGLQHWTWETKARVKGGEARKWHIDHEYHVQNLLWFLLSPMLPDAQKEVNLPPVGSLSPRADIVIPSMQLVIEIKFLRPLQDTNEIIRGIAQDRGLYINDESEYESIIAFVWDDSRRTEQHSLLQDGLRKIDNVVAAVIVSRPGIMSESEATSETEEAQPSASQENADDVQS